MTEVERLARALNHPIRRQILASLAHGCASVSVLAKETGASRPLVTYHLSDVLVDDCDAVEVADVIRGRGGEEKLFRLKPRPFIEALMSLDFLEWSPDLVDAECWWEIRQTARCLMTTVAAAVNDNREHERAPIESDDLHRIVVVLAAISATFFQGEGGTER